MSHSTVDGWITVRIEFSANTGLEENLIATVLRRNTYFNEEPDSLLLEDLRRDVTYGSILRAIATGRRRPSDIARAIGKAPAQDVSAQLGALLDLELIRREVPITERHQPRSRTSRYVLADNYLAFWYRYVDLGRSLVAQGPGERVLGRIRATFHAHVSRPPFEEVCRQFLWRAYAGGALPVGLDFDAVGTWWDGDHEIDVVAMEGSTTVPVGSCTWTNARVGLRELRRSMRRCRRAAEHSRRRRTPGSRSFRARASRQTSLPSPVLRDSACSYTRPLIIFSASCCIWRSRGTGDDSADMDPHQLESSREMRVCAKASSPLIRWSRRGRMP